MKHPRTRLRGGSRATGAAGSARPAGYSFRARQRLLFAVLLVAAAAMVGLFLVAIRARGSGDDGQDTSRTAVPVWAAGLVGAGRP